MNGSYVYDSAFQNMAATGSAHAARRIIAAARTILPIGSVIDLGCARGTWLREWRAQTGGGISGVDGAYVDRDRLEIDPANFIVHDLNMAFRHDRRYDLAQSLEVAEHLPAARAASFVADLVALAPVVLFSAASPGQGGENHINEQPADYWRALFREHDYFAIDCLRPLLAREEGIPAWYRHNLILYAGKDSLDRISPFARQFQARDGEPLADYAALPRRLRNRVVRTLPQAVCNRLAQWNARRFPLSA